MATKMAVYFTKYKKKIPWDRQTPGIRMQNADFTDSWATDIILVTFQWSS